MGGSLAKSVRHESYSVRHVVTDAGFWVNCPLSDRWRYLHDLGAGGDDRTKLTTVNHFRRTGLLMTGETGDLLDRHAACGHDADESVAQLPGNPLFA